MIKEAKKVEQIAQSFKHLQPNSFVLIKQKSLPILVKVKKIVESELEMLKDLSFLKKIGK